MVAISGPWLPLAIDARPGQYPENWDQIAQEIKSLAGYCCEQCGHPDDRATGHVLTVHHLDGEPSNCTYENLVALCQRCHLSIQQWYATGQLWLWPQKRPAWAERRGL